MQGITKTLYVAGEAVEIWEDPTRGFGWTRDELHEYALKKRWVTLFNALVFAGGIEENAEEFPC